MNKNKICTIIYYTAAFCGYITATIYFVKPIKYLGVLWLCLGSTFLCLGSIYLIKFRKEKDEDVKNTKNKN